MYMRHFSPSRPSCDLHYLWFFSRNMSKGVPKKYRTQNYRFSKKFFRSISPKVTQKTENDTVGRYRFFWNLDSKFYVRKQIFWAMGEGGRGFGLDFMRKSKLKKNLKKLKKKYWIRWFLIFYFVCCCSSQEQPEHKLLLCIKSFPYL